jgi:ketosteroid isomerase-like protein
MKLRLLALLLLLLFPLFAQAQEDPARAELRRLGASLLAAMNQGEVEAQLGYLHPNVVVTWPDAEVSRGVPAVREYLQRMKDGKGKVEKFSVEPTVDEPGLIYGGDTAVAFGSAREQLTLANGRLLAVMGRWSATLVKQDGQWLVASLHCSDNLFDNPLLNQFKSVLPWIGGASFIMGLFFGWMVARRGLAR